MSDTSPQICDQCNGAGGDNQHWLCQKCYGSGGTITITLGIPDARKTIEALHDKEHTWYERGQAKDSTPARQAYCDIEQQAVARIREAFERLMP